MQKMIRKFQSGGTNAYVTYTPFTKPTSPTRTVSAGDAGIGGGQLSNESKLTDKDLMTMIKEIDGLPSDIDVTINKIKSLTATTNLFEGNGLSSNNLVSTYLQALGEIKKATFGKKYWDEAYLHANSNGALGECAISTDGRLYVQDGLGEIKLLTTQEYLANKDKYATLTNSNLLLIRAHDTQFAGNNAIFQTVDNGIGMEKVTKLIHEGMDKLGSSEMERLGYLSLEALKGLQVLQEVRSRGIDPSTLMTVDGLYESKIINKNQANLAKRALEYIWAMLPTNARTLLQVKSGDAENPNRGAITLLTSIITAGTSDLFTFTPNLKSDLNSDGSKKSSTSEELNGAQRLQMGYGENVEFQIINGTANGLLVKGTKLSTGTGVNNSLLKLSEGEFGQILDFLNMSAGGVKISSGFASEILTDGTIYSCELPYTKDDNGNIKPDLELLNKLDAADKYIKLNKIVDPNQINEIYQSLGLPVKYNTNGEVIADNYMRFAAINGTVLGRAFAEEPAFELEEITDENEIDSLIQVFKLATGDNKKFKFDKATWWDNMLGNPLNMFSTNDSIYKTTIFMPMSSNIFVGMTNGINPKTALGYKAKQQLSDNLRSYLKAPSISY